MKYLAISQILKHVKKKKNKIIDVNRNKFFWKATVDWLNGSSSLPYVHALQYKIFAIFPTAEAETLFLSWELFLYFSLFLAIKENKKW